MRRVIVWLLASYAALMAALLGWAYIDWQTHYRKRLRAML